MSIIYKCTKDSDWIESKGFPEYCEKCGEKLR